MSQTSRFTRARQLTSTVLPGRRLDGYADQVTGRLRRIAAARGTGMLPFSGRSDGSIYFRDGKVALAESDPDSRSGPHLHRPASRQTSRAETKSRLSWLSRSRPSTPRSNCSPSNRALRNSGRRRSRTPARCRTSRWTRCWPRWPGASVCSGTVRRAVADTALARNPHIRPDATLGKQYHLDPPAQELRCRTPVPVPASSNGRRPTWRWPGTTSSASRTTSRSEPAGRRTSPFRPGAMS